MESGQRWRRGLRWAAVGLLTGILATVLNAQATAARPASLGWAYWLQNTANLTKVVELAIFMFSGYQFWAGRRDRNRADVEGAEQARIDSIYQAWQVVNSAQGKGGSGGRIEALSDLLRQGVSLAGINLDGAWLEGVELAGATLVRGSLQRTNLSKANLAGANLEGADLREAILVTANLAGANLRGADLSGARLSAATLDGADLNDVVGWDKIASLSYASVDGVRNAPKGFLDFARGHGAVDHSTTKLLEDDEVSHSQHFRVV
jgi:uncharacterized protein YjbI with pentapeptide repeats